MRKSAATPKCHIWILLGLFFIWVASVAVHAQDTKNAALAIEPAEIKKLAPLNYPPLARQTGLSGDVEVRVEVRQDESVVSAVAVSGHPLLVQAALDNARNSQFVCEHCGEEMHSYRLVYTFKLMAADESAEKETATNNPAHPTLRVTQSGNHILVTDRPIRLIDYGPDVRARSIKCLYLWRCGRLRFE